MKKIGFIDYYIDEWHANNYPGFIKKSRLGAQFEVALAWEETTPSGKIGLDAWCRREGVTPAASIEKVIRECDCLVVLSPDNPECHERLCDLPLRSGKPVYVDKTFAPDLATAKRLVALAEKHKTPMMTSSALRYGSVLRKTVTEKLAQSPARFVSTSGPGLFSNYSIHQVEMLVMTLGTGASRVMQCGTPDSRVMVIDYPDGRRGLIQLSPELPFRLLCQHGENLGFSVESFDDFFDGFIDAMLEFFRTGISSVPAKETLEIMAILEAGNASLAARDAWFPVPK